MQIKIAGPGEYVTAAAGIWAQATAARDGDDEIAPLSEAVPVIERDLSLLVVAVDETGTVVGFAAVSAAGSTGHVRCLGVHPGSWGRGVGRLLTSALPGHLAAAGFSHGELEVYLDNQRAVRLYEGLGWRPVGDPAPHPRSGRLEQRYQIEVSE
ncbi:GNAT family N-acetyltransferase [Actinoplanes sp. G11-F43]|uniref:GNAT family N-acetyltransferase n=1 Tax=Actinoplanes sp. G11-F43 TaxID=3424130 RepID=UPI003D356AFC